MLIIYFLEISTHWILISRLWALVYFIIYIANLRCFFVKPLTAEKKSHHDDSQPYMSVIRKKIWFLDFKIVNGIN